MARISFVMMPEVGHVLPTIPVARTLVRRGHHVSYLTVPHLCRFLRSLDLDCTVLPIESVVEGDDPWSASMSGHMIARAMSQQWRSAGVSGPDVVLRGLRDQNPDLVACDVTFAPWLGEIVRDRLHRPVAVVRTWLPDTDASRFPEVVLCPAEFELPEWRRSSARRHYCEPSVWRDRELLASREPMRAGADRTVYCSLGTQSSNYRDALHVLTSVIAAFDGLGGYRLILAAGVLYDQIASRARPPRVSIVASLSQLELLSNVDVVITHGGLGTLKEAIMNRVPMLVIPFMFDQPANGKRVAYHRIGHVCEPADCTAERIRECVRGLARAADVRDRLAALSRIFWAREQEPRAADVLEAALTGEVT